MLRVSKCCHRRLLGLGRHAGFHSLTCQCTTTMESKAAAELLSLHHGNWGKKTKMYVGLQYCPPQSRQQSPETQGVCCPATVCRSGPGQLQPGCFQIQTLLWPQMRRPLVTSEQRPMMNFRKDQQIPWPATKCGNSTEARSEGDKEGKHHFKW